MENYLIKQGNSTEHFFYKPYCGICVRKSSPRGTFSEHTQIIKTGKEPFSAIDTDDGCIHIISTDNENNLVYAARKKDLWKSCILSKLPADLIVHKTSLYLVRGRLNILYSATFKGEILLIHCILAGHAKPRAVTKLMYPDFFVFKNNVYYTTPDGALGFTSLSDEKPLLCNRLYDNAHQVFLWENSGKEFIAFVRDSTLFINGREIVYDKMMEKPIFVSGKEQLYIMWKSGAFIKYIFSLNDASTWSGPLQFISSNHTPKIYALKHGNDTNFYYGIDNGKRIHLFGASDIFLSFTKI